MRIGGVSHWQLFPIPHHQIRNFILLITTIRKQSQGNFGKRKAMALLILLLLFDLIGFSLIPSFLSSGHKKDKRNSK
jgi:hypothetical protein